MAAAPKPANRRTAKHPGGEAEVLAKIAQMSAPYRAIGERLHAIIMESAPGLAPRVRYGMPWYMKDAKSWCYFRAAEKFGFVTFGFDDPAGLATNGLVASAYRIHTLDAAGEAMLCAVLREAASQAAA